MAVRQDVMPSNEHDKIIYLRWATRTVLTLLEIVLIGYIVYLIFGENRLAEDMHNSLSVVLGGLLLNFGKSSSFWFEKSKSDEK